VKQQAGRFLGHFLSGMAEGLKDKEADGRSMEIFEPGNFRNGVLNGLSESIEDQINIFSEDMKKSQPYLEVPAGTQFLIYFDKEFKY